MTPAPPPPRPTGRTVTTDADHCGHPACGQPQNGPGRPRRGWIRVHIADPTADPDRWFCSWRCLCIAAIRAELGFAPLTAPTTGGTP